MRKAKKVNVDQVRIYQQRDIYEGVVESDGSSNSRPKVTRSEGLDEPRHKRKPEERNNDRKRSSGRSWADNHHIKRRLPGSHVFNKRRERVPSSISSGPANRRMTRRESSPGPSKAAKRRPGLSRGSSLCTPRRVVTQEIAARSRQLPPRKFCSHPSTGIATKERPARSRRVQLERSRPYNLRNHQQNRVRNKGVHESWKNPSRRRSESLKVL
ncbi:hypothetical protein TNCV_297571 [Trichonephila clavipes]|nr:hypothetical protein TNCV_297571 [Trichonephila clavipes]